MPTVPIEFDLVNWVCPICNEKSDKVLGLRGGSYQRANLGITTPIKQCKSCNLLFPDPFPIPRNIEALYDSPESYFAGHSSSEKVRLNRATIRKIKEQLGEKITILDVGSGCGEFLQAAIEENIQASGIEFSSAMVAYAKSQFNLNVEQLSIEDAAEKWPEKFDAIILNAVLEHVHQPQSMIAAASKLVRKGGIIYIDVPNEPNLVTMMANFWNRICRSQAVYNLSPTWSPFHVYGFNPKALRILLENNKFESLKFEIYAPATYQFNNRIADNVKAVLANLLTAIANLTGTSSNLVVWAKKGD